MNRDDRRRWAGGPALAFAASLIASQAIGQTPDSRPQEKTSGAKPSEKNGVLEDSRLYYFNEVYRPAKSAGAKPAGESAIGQYMVGFIDDRSRTPVGSNAKSVPLRETARVRYVERADEVYEIEPNRLVSSVRRYESVSVTKTEGSKTETKENKNMRGATISRRERPEGQPTIVMLSPVRPIELDEYRLMTVRDVFAPHLNLLLPEKAIGVGETWKVRNEGATRLIGRDSLGNGELIGTFKEFRTAKDGKTRLAIFRLVGRGTDPEVVAELTFAFEPPPVPKGEGDEPKAEAGDLPYTPATGAIVKLNLAVEFGQQIDRSGRNQILWRRNLFFQRSLRKTGEPLNVPEKPVEPSPENSWLLFRDPAGRFSVRFPQSFPPSSNTGPKKPDEPLVLEHADAEGTHDLLIVAPSQPNQTVGDYFAEAFRYAQKGTGAELFPQMGENRPSPKWPGMRVDHRVAEFRSGKKAQATGRRLDVYVIRLNSGGTFTAQAVTNRRDSGPFRELVGSILKTIRSERDSKN